MAKIRVAINGFGRIGRVTARAMMKEDGVQLVAINDLTDTRTLAHLFKYDSVHGRFDGTIEHREDALIINGNEIAVSAMRDPKTLPWSDYQVDVVIESTGIFRDRESASAHLAAGAKKVIISAPAKGNDVKTVVMGVNDDSLDGTETIVSNASCTTNCAAPMVKVIDGLCGVESGYITTIHAYTGDQNIHDAPHSNCLLYTSPSPRDGATSRMPSSA